MRFNTTISMIIWWILLIIPAILAKRNSGRGFKVKPQDIAAKLGEDIILKCAADTSDVLQIQWKHSSGAMLGTSSEIKGFQNRLSYLQESPSELNLHIKNVTMEDDGVFECQIMTVDAIRATVRLQVLVTPGQAYFQNYDSDSKVAVNEGTHLQVTCVSPNAKPPGIITWFANGKQIEENVERWEQPLNGVISSYATLKWTPSKNDHEKMLTCEVKHDLTQSSQRISLEMDVFYSSEKPVVEIQTDSDSVKLGQNVSLICAAKGGNPPPKLLWYLNNKAEQGVYEYDKTKDITRSVFSFTAKASDNGAVYTCSSSNRKTAPAINSTAVLEVNYPASSVNFVNGSTFVRLGDSITITCRSEPSNPPSAINWFLDGQPFVDATPRNEHRTEIGTVSESNLMIRTDSFPPEKQQVMVECSALNSEGSAKKQHTVRVYSRPSPPKIIVPDVIAHLEGQVLVLACETSGGNPLPSISWYRGKQHMGGVNETIDGDKRQSKIQFTLDRTMNNLPLRCEVNNLALDTPLADSISLKVLFPPNAMDIQPISEELIDGRPTRLSCAVNNSNPEPEINWEIDEEGKNRALRLTDTAQQRDSEGNFTSVVTFTPTEEMNGKTARCMASHPLWDKVKVAEYKLSVLFSPRFKADSPIKLSLNESTTFREDILLKANPEVTLHRYSWKKNGISISDRVGNIYVRESTIGGTNITSADSGVYTLVAENKVGSNSIQIELDVKFSARIIHISTPIYVQNEGDDVVMECNAQANPIVAGMVKWKKDGRYVSSIHQDDNSRAVLRLKVSRHNVGEYICEADNGIGQANFSTAHVLLYSAPKIVRGYERAAGQIGGHARVKCVAHAVPSASFIWRIGNTVLRSDSKYQMDERKIDHDTLESVLTIRNINQLDYGKAIECRVQNSKGSALSKIDVGPHSIPEKPSNIQVENDSTHAKLIWLPGFDGGYEQLFEIHFMGNDADKKFNISNNNFKIPDLKPAHAYSARIRAINQLGGTDWSPKVTIMTLNANGTVFRGDIGENIFADNWLLMIMVAIGILLVVNCCVFICMYTQHRRKKRAEKTQFVRQSNYGENRRNLQLYGTIGAGGGLSPATLIKRPESNNTNKSDIFNEPMSEDEQSVRTMIQVSPNVPFTRQPPVNRFYDGNYIADPSNDPSCYSVINKNGTIRSNYINFKDPSLNGNGSPSLTYADIGGSLRRGVDSPRRFGSVSGSINDEGRYGPYTGTGTLPRRTPQPSFTTFGGNPRIVGNPDGDLV